MGQACRPVTPPPRGGRLGAKAQCCNCKDGSRTSSGSFEEDDITPGTLHIEHGANRSPSYFDQEIDEVIALLDPCHARERYIFQTGAIYIGAWSGNARHGLGEQTWPDGATYVGEWCDNFAHGRGSFTHCDGDKYIGEWIANAAHGLGSYIKEGYRYMGEWRDDMQDGSGIEYWEEDKVVLGRFYGQFRRGVKHGYGTYTSHESKSSYSGAWKQDCMHGYGIKTASDGSSTCSGVFESSLMHGVVKHSWKDGRSYEGQFQNDLRNGYGTFSWSDGQKYEGFWRSDLQHGQAKCGFKDGDEAMTKWTDGSRSLFANGSRMWKITGVEGPKRWKVT